MSEIAIRVHGLAKRYNIGLREKYPTIRESLTRTLSAPLRAVHSWLSGKSNAAGPASIWALRDVDLEVKQGQVVGIIGRNGAGKSTLLKILSGITEPTAGYADIYGRVGTLLEVGTGFHMELTGRENIFMNGAMLGMRRHEIKRKFDEIVAFAEVEEYLDTPVKRYSTGMYMRLAFAVAAHLDPEILLVDEVLAVGDSGFQRKCLGKMKMVAQQGRTVIFVSHNMGAITALCSYAIVLEKGKITCRGIPKDCITFYAGQSSHSTCSTWTRSAEEVSRTLVITQVHSSFRGEQPNLILDLEVLLESRSKHKAAFIAIDILDGAGVALMQAIPKPSGFIESNRRWHSLRVEINLPSLIPGQYRLTIWVGSHNAETLDEVNEVVTFEIFESPINGRTYPHTSDHGYIVPPSIVKSF